MDSMGTESEIPLEGGQNATGIVRMGNTVRRPKGPNAEFTHALLKYLEEKHFDFSPRHLGIDEKGREILSFIEGTVPREAPLQFTQKQEAIRIMRQFHDVCVHSKHAGLEETVCHHDFAPWNVIVHDNKVVGIIDFDEAAPGKRIDDLAYFLWTFLDLGNTTVPSPIQIEQMTALVQTYGPINRAELIPAILRQQERILAFRKKRALEEEGTENEFSKGAVVRIEASIKWIQEYQSEIYKALEPQINDPKD